MIRRTSLQRLATPAKRLMAGEQLVRRNPVWFAPAAARFARLDAAPYEARRAWAATQLRRALAHAARTAYGRRVGGGGALESWPLLEPARVREAPREFVLGGRWALPAATGGTTGVPLPLWRSLRSVAVEQAALDHLLRAHGVNPRRARVAVLRGDDVKPIADRTPPFAIDVHDGRRRIYSSNHLAPDTIGSFAESLRAFGADYWWVYPTALGSLLRLAAAAGERLNVPLVFASSELLSPELHRAARSALGAVVVDYYGQAERVAFAWCDAPEAWRFLPGYAHVELLPHGGALGGTLYEIVGTVLWNEAMPLVRYRTGDLVRFEAPPEPREIEEIALGVRPFPGVIGRDGDILVAPDGTQLTGIDHFHRGVDGIVRLQVAHLEPGWVELRVLPAGQFGPAQAAALEANARAKLPPSMRLTVRIVEELERTAAGKTPFVVRGPGVTRPGRAVPA